jgi:UDP-3-O-[3-hydroxymyristoyl] glucosamine N-acyltransferase
MKSNSSTNGHSNGTSNGNGVLDAPKPGASGMDAGVLRSSALNAPRPVSRQVTVGEIARLLGAELVGDAKTLITGVSGLDSALPGTIAFIEKESLLPTALDSSVSAIIAPASLADKVRLSDRKKGFQGKPAVLTVNPRLAFAKVMEYMQPLDLPETGIHPTAIIEPDAHIGEGVTIREYCYVGHHAHIADGAVLYPHVVIGNGAQIGEASILYPSVVINHHVHIGARVRIHSGSVIGGDGFGYVQDAGKHHKVPQIGTVIIEEDVEIGANVCIDRAMLGATRVGSGTKIDNLVQIGHNAQIGKNCILCSLVGMSGSVVVEDNVMIGGQVGIRDHSKVGKGAVLGAQCGVMNNIGAGEFVVGSPAVPQRDFFRQEAASRKMPEALRTLRGLEKQVRELQEQLAKMQSDNSDNNE